jgi:hypothetical protein
MHVLQPVFNRCFWRRLSKLRRRISKASDPSTQGSVLHRVGLSSAGQKVAYAHLSGGVHRDLSSSLPRLSCERPGADFAPWTSESRREEWARYALAVDKGSALLPEIPRISNPYEREVGKPLKCRSVAVISSEYKRGANLIKKGEKPL